VGRGCPRSRDPSSVSRQRDHGNQTVCDPLPVDRERVKKVVDEALDRPVEPMEQSERETWVWFWRRRLHQALAGAGCQS